MGVNVLGRRCKTYIPLCRPLGVPAPDDDLAEEPMAPNPARFRIISLESFGDFVVAKIQYPDCTNFEGIKICLFYKVSSTALVGRKEIDPHFEKGYDSPIARFEPTPFGEQLCRYVAYKLQHKDLSIDKVRDLLD